MDNIANEFLKQRRQQLMLKAFGFAAALTDRALDVMSGDDAEQPAAVRKDYDALIEAPQKSLAASRLAIPSFDAPKPSEVIPQKEEAPLKSIGELIREQVKDVLEKELGAVLQDASWRIKQALEKEAGTGQIIAEQLNLRRHQLTGFTVTDNSPGAGSIAWADCHVVFQGADIAITNGNTALKYVWWDNDAVPNTAFQSSNTKPALTDQDCLVFINDGGLHHTVIGATAQHGATLIGATVDAGEIKDGAVVGTKIAALAITEAKIAGGAVTDVKIGSGAVTDTKIATGAVTNVKLGASAVDATKLADNAVTTTKINAGAVVDTKIADSAVTTAKINNSAVDANKLATNAVTGAKIADNAVTDTKINAGAVTETKIGTGAITDTKIASGAVSEIKIGAGAVTNAKLGDLAVTGAKIADNSVTGAKVQNGQINTSKLNLLSHLIY